MERDPNVLVAEVEGRPLLLNVRTWTYLSFNETGARIWHHLEKPQDRAALLTLLRDEFEAPEAEIAADLDLFLTELRDQDFLRDLQ